MNKLKAELSIRGINGFVGMQRKLRALNNDGSNDDGSNVVNLAEFKKAIREFTGAINDADIRMLFSYFDTENIGIINIEDFITSFREQLSKQRKLVVDLAFSKLDKSNIGILDATTIATVFDASAHPEVMSGKKSANIVFNEFLETFDVGETIEGKVTQQEFENYYSYVSSTIDDDSYFEIMLRNIWHIAVKAAWPTTNCLNRSSHELNVSSIDFAETGLVGDPVPHSKTLGQQIRPHTEYGSVPPPSVAGISARSAPSDIFHIRPEPKNAEVGSGSSLRDQYHMGTRNSLIVSNRFKTNPTFTSQIQFS